jgi:hypothetical protein
MTRAVDDEVFSQADPVSTEAEQALHESLDDHFTPDIDINFDDVVMVADIDGGEISEVVNEAFAINSFEDLEALVCADTPYASGSYVFKAKDVGSDFTVSSDSPRIALDYLPAYIGLSREKLNYTPDSIKALKYISHYMEFDKELIEDALKCFEKIDVLNSSTLFSFDKGVLKLPYGEFAVSNQATSVFNPLLVQRIVDIYCDKTNFARDEIIKVIERNLYEQIYSNDDLTTPIAELGGHQLYAAIGFPELKAKEYSVLSNNASNAWQAIDDFFFRTILPLALMNDAFKSFVGCSLLTHDDFTSSNYERMGVAYAYYACGLKDISRVLNTKYRDIASFDASAIFAGKYSLSTQKRAELFIDKQENAVKKQVITSTFAIDGEKRQKIELTGLSVSSDAMNAFTALGQKHPHFSKVFDYLLPFVESSFFNGSPLVIPPMLIAGPPGIGKTKFLSELFAVFGYPISHCHSSQFTCGSGLVGLQSTWSNTQPGYVAETLRRTKFFNPLIAFDELERVRMSTSSGNGISVEAAFMRLLEPLEATRFVDACGQLPHDVSKVNWIFTCNDPLSIPPALLSRLNKVCVYPPTEESVIDNIHRDIWLDLVNQYASGSLIKPWVSADALESLREVYYGDLNFRSGIKIMKNCLNKLMSGVQDSNYLTLDVIASKTLKRASLN